MAGTLTRRGFLSQAAMGVAAASALAWRPLSAQGAAAARAQRILVVGAGMAGLSAAFELVAQGHDVTILEARTRPGGRVQTLRDVFPDGLYADAGAMQVYDSHARAQRYIRQFGLETDPIQATAPGAILHVMGRRLETRAGEAVAWPFPLRDTEKHLDSRGLYAKYVVPHLAAVHAADAEGLLLEKLGHLDRMTFAEFLGTEGASPAAINILNVGLPIGLGDGGRHHSALNLLREAAYRQVRKQAFTIRGGTDRLPKALASRLAGRIHYGTPVVRIEQDAAGVRAFARSRGVPRTYTGDRIICAIPFSVLRNVAMAPALSPLKRAAIGQMENTSVVKVFLQTRTRFWLAEGQSGSVSTDLPLTLVSERTINQPGTRGILEAYVAGAHARNLCALSESERLRTVVAGMAEIFPRVADEYEGGATKCWDDDEWARGAYAWFRPGQMTSLLPHVAGAEGRIHFAGDHTSPTPGWMEGALHSAERVVREIKGA